MKEKLIIIGGGGHCKVILDILIENDEYEICGIIDNEYKKIYGIEVIGKDEDCKEIFKSGIKHAFVAIGNNALRKKIFESLTDIGYNMVNVISRSSKLSNYAVLGKGIAIMPGVVINASTKIEDGCILNTCSHIDHDCEIGKFTHISTGAGICGGVVVGESCFICTGSNIIDGICIGNYVTVGAGSVVIRNISDNCTVLGIPAKRIER